MYKIYQVEYGDTIDIIANKTGTIANNIKNINGINSNADLVVGSLIIVPREENQLFQTYIVKKGDSVYSIARAYNVDPSTLLLLNGLNKDDIIYPNQEITVPRNGVVVYVTRQGDTINAITNNLGIDGNTLNKENERIFVLEDQLVVHKKEGNN
ncbi:MAG: LysM peptidoglycan-binding domain-containing protein [Bacilli bacterium]|nr:LysM peptidoglycan-binding domain-containing protein [Bacilli bacterium]